MHVRTWNFEKKLESMEVIYLDPCALQKVVQAKLRLEFRKVVVPLSSPCNRNAHAVIT